MKSNLIVKIIIAILISACLIGTAIFVIVKVTSNNGDTPNSDSDDDDNYGYIDDGGWTDVE